MDGLEDFEMKPLTEGLGFHKKSIKLSEETKKFKLEKEKLPKSVPNAPSKKFFEAEDIGKPLAYEDLLKSLGESESERAVDSMQSHLKDYSFSEEATSAEPKGSGLEISEPLKRKEDRLKSDAGFELPVDRGELPAPMPLDDLFPEQPALPPASDTFDDIPIPGGIGPIKKQPVAPTEKKAQKKADTGVRRSSSNAPTSKLVPSPICLRSIFLDALVVTAMALVFLASLILVTGVTFNTVIGSFENDIATQIPLLILYIAIYQIYVIGTRSFFGRTLGEWTFDHQLGREEEHEKGIYPLKVVFRSFIIVGTGIVTLPLLSFLFRKDVAKYLSNLQLYKVRG